MDLARFALLVSVCLADGILLFKVGPAAAAEIISNVAPPPLRTENVGRPRDGYVWAPGHWEWNSQSYRWVSGSWIVERGKARWIADQWEPQGTQWRFVPGHWER
jgi:YXWGXW repeat-containing protein